MKEFWDKYKIAIIFILIILIVAGIIYYVGKKAGSKYKPSDIVIPNDLQAPGTPNLYNPAPITDAIFEDLDERFGVHESEPYEAAMKLSNSQLAAVYNDWNKRYSSKFDNKTIIQALDGDFSVWNITWEHLVQNLITRFQTLPGAQGRNKNII